ncbi:tetratricopeptide repeat-containing sensor histidine kinase [Owenweeksia hongkongensis]|uniref:tetratricopeptide repeat-containing sensor histidine kinase n=1 Tax=Owenweeksia hongkongensis TaxID=253245 RepID=UPI003A91A318
MLVIVCSLTPYSVAGTLRKNDSIKTVEHIRASQRWLNLNLDSAEKHAEKSVSLSKEIDNVFLYCKAIDHKAIVVEKLGDWTKALNLLDESIQISLAQSWYLEAGQSLLHLGNLYYRKGEFEELKEDFEEADRSFQLALSKYRRGLDQIVLARDTLWAAHAYLNIGAAYFKLYEDSMALSSYLKSESLFRNVAEYLYIANLQSNIGLILQNNGDLDSASYYFSEARLYFIEQNNLKNWINTNLNLASVWEVKDLNKAIDYLHEADSLSVELNNNVQRSIIQEYLYRLYSKLGDNENALFHLEEYVALKDSLLSSDFKSEELSVRYESGRQKELIEKQRNENLRKELALSKSKSEKQILWVGLTIALVSVGSLLALGWYKKRVRFVIQKQREKISAQKIDQLKKEQAVKTIEALLQGQEKERGRISEDLHDRLGSTLSAVRMQIEAYGESVDTSDSESVKKLLALVDRAIEETRSISHNLISGVLARFGLEAALKELQENFNVSQRVKVHLKIGELNSMESEFEVVVFRIVQEILNNALRHSDAENIWIDVGMRGDTLRLEIKDDGSGFDLEQKSTGMGLKNINTRVTRLEGNLNIASHLGGGTCFKIQIPLKNETSKYLNC